LLFAGIRRPRGKRGDGWVVRHTPLVFEHEVPPRRPSDGMRSDKIEVSKIRSEQALDGDSSAEPGGRSFDGET